MTGNAPAAAAATSAPAAPAGNTIPKKARVAMMTEKKHFEPVSYTHLMNPLDTPVGVQRYSFSAL